jgi:hypothetical protein
VQILDLVSSRLSEPPVTTASAIISGTDTHLTNKLLQQLALCAYCCRRSCGQSELSAPGTAEPKHSQVHTDKKKIATSASCWPTKIKILLSKDGEEWLDGIPSGSDGINTTLTNADDIFECKLPVDFSVAGDSLREVKYVRIIPMVWNHQMNMQSAVTAQISSDRTPPTLRISLKCLADASGDITASEPNTLASSNQAITASSTNISLFSEVQARIIDLLLSAFDSMYEAARVCFQGLELLSNIEDVLKQRKQEETRKVGLLCYSDCETVMMCICSKWKA